MNDKLQPKSKKPAKATKASKKPVGPKLVAKDIKPGIGHNSGEKHPEVVKCFAELMLYQTQKKSIAKAERDVRNRLKTEFGIMSTSVAREVVLQKLDPDVRVQVETNHDDTKKMLGYQLQLDSIAGKPTQASVKAQASEAELAKNDPGDEEGFHIEDGDGTEADEDDGTEPEDTGGDKMPPIPRNLQRGSKKDVIEREG